MLGWGTPVGCRLKRLPQSAGHTALYSWVASGTAVSRSPAGMHVWHCLLVQQRAVAGLEQMHHQKQECFPCARTPEGPSSEPRAQEKHAGADARPATAAMWALWLQTTVHAQCAQCIWACSALQGATICCGCFHVWCSLLLVCTHLLFPFAWKRRGRRGISHRFTI